MAEDLRVKDLIHSHGGTLTPAERRLSDVLLRDYPVAGLQSVTKLAEAAGVSTPTVIRMARKLGYDGFPELQAALRKEASDSINAPVTERSGRRERKLSLGAFGEFAEAVFENLDKTIDRLDPVSLEAVAALLADPARTIFLAGGRITRSNADYFFNHLQIIRTSVKLLSGSVNSWPQDILDMDGQAVLVLFDIRRYESDLARLAELAVERGATIVLFTDQWGSPISNSRGTCGECDGRSSIKLGFHNCNQSDCGGPRGRSAGSDRSCRARSDRSVGSDVQSNPDIPTFILNLRLGMRMPQKCDLREYMREAFRKTPSPGGGGAGLLPTRAIPSQACRTRRMWFFSECSRKCGRGPFQAGNKLADPYAKLAKADAAMRRNCRRLQVRARDPEQITTRRICFKRSRSVMVAQRLRSVVARSRSRVSLSRYAGQPELSESSPDLVVVHTLLCHDPILRQSCQRPIGLCCRYARLRCSMAIMTPPLSPSGITTL